MKKYIITSMILGILVLLYFLYPYYSAYKLVMSLKEGDRYKLENYINFTSVRASLKEQIHAKMMDEFIMGKELKDNPFAGLAMMIAPKMIDYLLDAYLTPSGIATLIGSRKLENNINKLQKPVLTETESGENINFWDLLSKAEYAFFTNPSTFLVEIEGTKFRFKLQDWSWKLAGIYFPDESNAKKETTKINPIAKLMGEKSLDETKLSEKEGQMYWIKSRAANVRAGPSTTYAIIVTLKQGDKVYLIDRVEKWCKVRLTGEKDNIGWIHSSLLSMSFVEPSPIIKIINIDTKVTETNNIWWRYAWRLTIRNSGSSPVSLTATIEFQDKDGFIIDKYVEDDLYVHPGKVKTFTGFELIDAKVAKNVSQVSAKVRR
ncbi:MAG: DUF2939 domain-containing protein [Deltaproteobacteria bacterium]|nr:DUF2939 domain-containing protein [Deltaproteobacteria bacterium]